MNSSNNETFDHNIILLNIVGASKASSKTPATFMFQGWNKLHGMVNVLMYSDAGGEDWQLNSEIDYRKGQTTWPEQHAVCTLGLKVRCVGDSQDVKLFHAYGLIEQRNKLQADFMNRVLNFRHPANHAPKFPAMYIELSETGLIIELDSSSEEIWANARDKKTALWKEVVDELESLIDDRSKNKPLPKKTRPAQERAEDDSNKVKVKARIDENLVVFIDSLAKDWGFKSRGDVINKILADIFADIPDN